MIKRLAVMALISVYSSACATLPEGTRVKVPNAGNNFFRSKITVYNNAGQSVVVIPFSQGTGFISEYQLGKRSPWCLWLCRKKIPKKIFALCHGQHLTIPLLLNTNGNYSAPVSISLKVYQNNGPLGTYLYCIYAPPGRQISEDLMFDQEKLNALKHGDYGSPCRNYYW